MILNKALNNIISKVKTTKIDTKMVTEGSHKAKKFLNKVIPMIKPKLMVVNKIFRIELNGLQILKSNNSPIKPDEITQRVEI